MKTNIIDIMSQFNYFVGKTKNIHDERYMNFTIYQPDENCEEGSICGYCRKDEILLLTMTMSFYSIDFEDALTYLSTMN